MEGRNCQSVVELMERGKLKVQPLITHRFPIEKGTKAYDIITGKKKEPFLGVLITYPEGKIKEETKILFPSVVHRQSSVVKLGVLGAGFFANDNLLPVLKNNMKFEIFV